MKGKGRWRQDDENSKHQCEANLLYKCKQGFAPRVDFAGLLLERAHQPFEITRHGCQIQRTERLFLCFAKPVNPISFPLTVGFVVSEDKHRGARPRDRVNCWCWQARVCISAISTPFFLFSCICCERGVVLGGMNPTEQGVSCRPEI